jgi:hypothetical protein
MEDQAKLMKRPSRARDCDFIFPEGALFSTGQAVRSTIFPLLGAGTVCADCWTEPTSSALPWSGAGAWLRSDVMGKIGGELTAEIVIGCHFVEVPRFTVAEVKI